LINAFLHTYEKRDGGKKIVMIDTIYLAKRIFYTHLGIVRFI